jgi:hypothetical protein
VHMGNCILFHSRCPVEASAECGPWVCPNSSTPRSVSE